MVFDTKTQWEGDEGKVQKYSSWEKAELQNVQPCL